MPLCDMTFDTPNPRDKDYHLADIDGLALCVAKTGGKAWHFRYYWAGKQQRMSLGGYPAIS